jgi:hypothetical protein
MTLNVNLECEFKETIKYVIILNYPMLLCNYYERYIVTPLKQRVRYVRIVEDPTGKDARCCSLNSDRR